MNSFFYHLTLPGFLFLAMSIVGLAQNSHSDTLRTYNLGEVIVTADRDNITRTTTSNEVTASEIQSLNASESRFPQKRSSLADISSRVYTNTSCNVYRWSTDIFAI